MANSVVLIRARLVDISARDQWHVHNHVFLQNPTEPCAYFQSELRS